jgi:hypothetical protein
LASANLLVCSSVSFRTDVFHSCSIVRSKLPERSTPLSPRVIPHPGTTYTLLSSLITETQTQIEMRKYRTRPSTLRHCNVCFIRLLYSCTHISLSQLFVALLTIGTPFSRRPLSYYPIHSQPPTNIDPIPISPSSLGLKLDTKTKHRSTTTGEFSAATLNPRPRPAIYSPAQGPLPDTHRLCMTRYRCPEPKTCSLSPSSEWH